MKCLWCNQAGQSKLNWSGLMIPRMIKSLCPDCLNELNVISDPRCRKCSRPFAGALCPDCLEWGKHSDPLEWNVSVYLYHDQIKEMLYQWKYRGDYELGYAFQAAFVRHFAAVRKMAGKDAVVVPIPLSEERAKERGFNQADMLASFLPCKRVEVLWRTGSQKQSKKTRRERLEGTNPFLLRERINKPVILVDDIYTTGSTLRHAAAVLKEGGAPSVFAYTLVRS